MKLRLPHKFQAALMAALASVSITTLSTGTTAQAWTAVTTKTTGEYVSTTESYTQHGWNYNASTGVITAPGGIWDNFNYELSVTKLAEGAANTGIVYVTSTAGNKWGLAAGKNGATKTGLGGVWGTNAAWGASNTFFKSQEDVAALDTDDDGLITMSAKINGNGTYIYSQEDVQGAAFMASTGLKDSVNAVTSLTIDKNYITKFRADYTSAEVTWEDGTVHHYDGVYEQKSGRSDAIKTDMGYKAYIVSSGAEVWFASGAGTVEIAGDLYVQGTYSDGYGALRLGSQSGGTLKMNGLMVLGADTVISADSENESIGTVEINGEIKGFGHKLTVVAKRGYNAPLTINGLVNLGAFDATSPVTFGASAVASLGNVNITNQAFTNNGQVTVTGGTINGYAGAGTLTKEGAGALTMGGTTNIRKTIQLEGGSLDLAGDVTVNVADIGSFDVFDSTGETYSYAAKNSGYLTSSGQYYLVKGAEGTTASHSGSITGGSYVDSPTKPKGNGDIIISFDTIGSTHYFVNESMETHDDATSGSYNILGATDVTIKKGATLTASSYSDAFTSPAKLHGEGTYALANARVALNNNLSLGDDWTGAVRISGNVNSLDLRSSSNLYNEHSSIILDGWEGRIANADQQVTADVQIGAGGAIFSADNNRVITFTKKLSGTGKIEMGNAGSQPINLTFTGDVSGYKGDFIYNRCNTINYNLVFSDAANEINAASFKMGSTGYGAFNVTFNAENTVVNSSLSRANSYSDHAVMNITANADTTFNGAVNANTLSIANAATLTIASPATIKAITGGGKLVNNASLTLGGKDDCTFTGAVSGSGDIEKVGSGKQSVTGNMVDFTGDITVTAGTLDINVSQSDGSITTHAVSVAEGASLNLKAGGYNGVLNANGTIYNNGNLEFTAMQLVLCPENHTAYELYGDDQKYTGTDAAAGSGFLNADARYYLVKAGENSTLSSWVMDVSGGTYLPPASLEDKNLLVKLDFGNSELKGTYYVNGNMTTHDDVKASKYDILSATDIVIADGVTLTAFTSSDAFTNTAKLHGEGTYALASGQAALNSNLSLGTDWTGAVAISKVSFANDMKGILEGLGNENSWVALKGTSGWAASCTINANLLLEKGDNDWAFAQNNGNDGHKLTFAGKIAGDGKLGRSSEKGSTYTYEFTNDISKWDGTFESRSFGDKYTMFRVKDVATEVNASLTKATGVFKVDVQNQATFNGAVSGVDELTVAANQSAKFTGALEVIGVINVGTGATLTLAGETSIAKAITNSGTVAFNSNVTATGLAVTTSNFNVGLDGKEISTDVTNANYFAGGQKDTITVVNGGAVTPNNHKVVQNDVEYTLGTDGKAVHTVQEVSYSTFYQHETGSELTLSAINEVATPHRIFGVNLVDVQGATLKIDSGYLYQVVAKDATIEVASSESVSVLEFIGGDNTVVGQVAAFEDHAAKFRRNVESSVDLKNADNSAYTMDLSSQDGVKFSTTAADGGVVTISAAAEEDADEAYTASESRYTVAATELAKAKQGNVTVGNHVEVSKVSNDAFAGKLTLSSGAAAAKLKEVSATSGDIEFYQMDNTMVQAQLTSLDIAANKSVSFYSSGVNDAKVEASVTVGGMLKAGLGATLNANLEMASGSTLDVSATGGAGLLMGSTVTLNTGMILADYTGDWSAWEDGTKYALFTGVDGLNIGLDGADPTGAIDYTQWVDASKYFTNITEQNRYFLCYEGAPTANAEAVLTAVGNNGSNVGMVYIMAMPEPTTGTLSLLALCALAARRRRK